MSEFTQPRSHLRHLCVRRLHSREGRVLLLGGDDGVVAAVADHGPVLGGGHHGLGVAARPLGPDEGRRVITDEVHHGLRRPVLLALGVVVVELELDVGEDAGAVVDLLDGVRDGAGDGAALTVVQLARRRSQVAQVNDGTKGTMDVNA